MDHNSPDQIDVESVRTQLVQQFKQVDRDIPAINMAAAIELTQIRRRRAKAALDRLDAGIYGLCCQCNMSVETEVLHFDPSAPFCNDCQSEVDLRRRNAR